MTDMQTLCLSVNHWHYVRDIMSVASCINSNCLQDVNQIEREIRSNGAFRSNLATRCIPLVHAKRARRPAGRPRALRARSKGLQRVSNQTGNLDRTKPRHTALTWRTFHCAMIFEQYIALCDEVWFDLNAPFDLISRSIWFTSWLQ